MSEDDDLQRLKEQRLLEMQRRGTDDNAKTKVDKEKQEALRVILTPEARQRLTNIKLVRPELAEQLELQLIQLAQTGRINIPMKDEHLRQILGKFTEKKRDTTIRRI